MSDAQLVEGLEVPTTRLARHLYWQHSMQGAVARALDEHRALHHTVAVMREDRVIALKPGEY